MSPSILEDKHFRHCVKHCKTSWGARWGGGLPASRQSSLLVVASVPGHNLLFCWMDTVRTETQQ